jgi:hypothetical protein
MGTERKFRTFAERGGAGTGARASWRSASRWRGSRPLLICSYIERNQQPAHTNLWLMSVRARLTHLAVEVEEFSSDFLRTFHGRIRHPLDATSEAEMHKPLVDQYEQNGHI